MRSEVKKKILFSIKLLVTIFLVAWIVQIVSWTKLWTLLLNSNPYLILFVVLLRFLSLPLSAYKWQKLLGVHGVYYSMVQLQKWYLAATFLGNFLPTSIGGDGYRLYKTINNNTGRSCAVLAIFVERLTGFSALLLLGYIAIIVRYCVSNDKFIKTMFTFFTVGGLFSILLFAFFVRLKILDNFKNSKYCPDKMISLINNIGIYKKNLIVIIEVVLISFAFHLNKIFCAWLLIYALGVNFDVFILTMVISVTQIIGLLPISLNGFGLIDGSFIYIMDYYGLAVETGLSTMFLLRALLLPMILVGAYFYVSDKAKN